MKNKTPLLITGLVILTLVSAFLGYELNTKNKQNQILESEITELESLMKGNGLNELMEDDISESLSNLLESYNSVNTDNQGLNDSIELQKQKVTLLLSELQDSEKRRKYTSRELYKMKKEAQTLRSVMKNYVHKVDSLNTLNKELQATIKVKDNTITKVSGERDNLKVQTESLSKTIEKGSKLRIVNLTAEAIRIRNSGSFTETTRARRADQIKSCFTIVENTISEVGNKTFFMRIISPEGKVLVNTKSSIIDVDESSIEVSISRTVDYQNNAVDLCIFYEKAMEALPGGDYKVEIYTEGTLVGTTTFALR
jgi:predicted RNase H-like nuclease (RuvC/YqgF family)